MAFCVKSIRAAPFFTYLSLLSLSLLFSPSYGYPISSIPDLTDVEKADVLNRWVEEEGVAINKVRAAAYKGMGVGTAATAQLKKGDVYIALPERLFISDKHLDSTELKHAAQQYRQSVRGNANSVLLRLALLFEAGVKGSASKWWAYICSLPKRVTSPLSMRVDEAEALLKGSLIVDDIRRQDARQREEYKLVQQHFLPLIPKNYHRAFTFELFAWASRLQNSRVINLEVDIGKPRVQTFIPYIDMVNSIESDDDTFVRFDPASRSAVIRADRNAEKGVQVFETYGNKSNFELFLYNGYVYDDVPFNDCVYRMLKFESAKKEETFKRAYPRSSRRVCIGARRGLPLEVLSFARLNAKKDSSIDVQEHSRKLQSGKPLSSRNELKAAKYLLKYVRHEVKSYPSSLEEDEEKVEEWKAEADQLRLKRGGRKGGGITELDIFNADMRFLSFKYMVEEKRALHRLHRVLKEAIRRLEVAVEGGTVLPLPVALAESLAHLDEKVTLADIVQPSVDEVTPA